MNKIFVTFLTSFLIYVGICTGSEINLAWDPYNNTEGSSVLGFNILDQYNNVVLFVPGANSTSGVVSISGTDTLNGINFYTCQTVFSDGNISGPSNVVGYAAHAQIASVFVWNPTVLPILGAGDALSKIVSTLPWGAHTNAGANVSYLCMVVVGPETTSSDSVIFYDSVDSSNWQTYSAQTFPTGIAIEAIPITGQNLFAEIGSVNYGDVTETTGSLGSIPVATPTPTPIPTATPNPSPTPTPSPTATPTPIPTASPTPTPSNNASASAVYISSDVKTQGNWIGNYGADGYNIVLNAIKYPTYATIGIINNNSSVWAQTTNSVNALQKPANPTDRIAACLYTSGNTLTIDIQITDGNMHTFSIYAMDWDSYGRIESLTVMDTNGNILDTRTISNFNTGEYLTWKISGHVQVVLTSIKDNSWVGKGNAVINGLFFDPANK